MKDFFKSNHILRPSATVLILYLVIGLFVYISVKESDGVKVLEKEARIVDDDAEIHPARTYLRIEDGVGVISYYARLEDNDTLMGLFDYHMEKSGFTFEKINYTYGIALDNVNGYKAPEGFEWRVYDDNTEITYDLSGRNIENEHTYTIRLEPSE